MDNMSFGNMSAGIQSRAVGDHHVSYYVCGSREMGTLGETRGEQLNCFYLSLVSVST